MRSGCVVFSGCFSPCLLLSPDTRGVGKAGTAGLDAPIWRNMGTGFAPYKPQEDGKMREPQPFRPGTDRCRPIAAGDFVMRVANSIGAEMDRAAMVDFLSPVQFGVGIPRGAEVVAFQHIDRS
jgi:hypothetical protein